jgi:hypothetical protein
MRFPSFPFALLILIQLSAMDLLAQDCPCCGPEYARFDFWLGDWNVQDTTGQQVGTNRIEKAQDGCLIIENWTSSSGSTGTSYNYFLKSDSTWNQVWIDDQGGVLELKGQRTGDSMVLQSELLKGTMLPLYYHRITWEKKRKSVIQTWEVLDEDLEVRSLVFKGIYTPR